MGEDTGNALSAGHANENIITFFEIEENREELFKEIINILEKEYDDFFYIKSKKKKFDSLEDCIINGHFQWIEDVSRNQIQTEFDSEYTDSCNLTKEFYIKFYETFNIVIKESKSFSKRAKKKLIKYSDFIVVSPT